MVAGIFFVGTIAIVIYMSTYSPKISVKEHSMFSFARFIITSNSAHFEDFPQQTFGGPAPHCCAVPLVLSPVKTFASAAPCNATSRSDNFAFSQNMF